MFTLAEGSHTKRGVEDRQLLLGLALVHNLLRQELLKRLAELLLLQCGDLLYRHCGGGEAVDGLQLEPEGRRSDRTEQAKRNADVL